MKSDKELSLRTMVMVIQAVDEQVGKYIDLVNNTDASMLDPNIELRLHDFSTAEIELKHVYEIMTENVSNFPPYNQLVKEHPRLKHIEENLKQK
jgi:putative heme degradation protein